MLKRWKIALAVAGAFIIGAGLFFSESSETSRAG